MDLNIKAYIKKPDSDFEPVVLTSTAQMKELIGTTGKASTQVHTPQGFSVYANPDAEGDCTGHTVDLKGNLRFWTGTYLVVRYKGTSLVDMDEFDLARFESSVLNKTDREVAIRNSTPEYAVDVNALRASMEERRDND